jgi:hypothetical protein
MNCFIHLQDDDLEFETLDLARSYLKSEGYVSEGVATPEDTGYLAFYERDQGEDPHRATSCTLWFPRKPGRIDEPTIDLDLDENEWAEHTAHSRDDSHLEWDENDPEQLELLLPV